MGNIKAFGANKKKKISTKESWYIFFIVVLSISVVFLLFLIFKGSFGVVPIVNNSFKNVGTDLTLIIDSCGGYTSAVNMYGSVLPDFEIEQNCYLKLTAEAEHCKARAKVFMFDNNNKYLNLKANFTSDWELKNDNYYYYNSIITPNLVLKFIKSITTPSSEASIFSGNIYTIYVTIETLPETADIESLWFNS